MKEENIVFAGNYELIPDGVYEAMVVKHETRTYYGSKKLYLWFRIITNGEFMGKEIFMPMNISNRMRRSSKYYSVWVIANNKIKPNKNDRMSPKIFMNKVYRVKTRTVAKGHKQTILAIDERYSVVDEILEVFVG